MSFLIAVFSSTLFNLTVCADGEAPYVWAFSSWSRALRTTLPEKLKPVIMYAAKNEWESFQIAVRSGKQVRITGIEVTDLTGKKKARISRNNIRLYRAHQLHITEASYRNTNFKEDWYPDALIPFKIPNGVERLPGARFHAVPFDLPAGESHTFWIDVYVPKSTPSGEYQGRAIVKFSGNVSVAIPIKLNVWSFALPRTACMKTQFGSPAARIAGWYREQVKKGRLKTIPDIDALYAQCAKLTSENRFNSYPPPRLLAIKPGPGGSFQLSAEQVSGLKKFMATYHVNALPVPAPHHYFKDPVKDKERIINYLRSWDTALTSIGNPDLLCYTYLIDEPNDPKAYSFTRTWGKLIRSSGSKVKVLVTEQTKTQNKSWNNLYGAIDIWVPLFSLFDPETARSRQAVGEEIWTYTALCQGKPTPWWETDLPLLNYRIPCWLGWLYGMKGLLYWGGMSYWKGVDDPWTEPGTYPRKTDAKGKKRTRVYNGEGTLLYPGLDLGFNGAVPSMRLKAIRDGLEDFDYLEILDSIGRRKVAEAVIKSIAPSWFEWSKEPLRYFHIRRKLGCLISNVYKEK